MLELCIITARILQGKFGDVPRGIVSFTYNGNPVE